MVAPIDGDEQRSDFSDTVNVVLPYDMQIGTGSWTLVPGATGQVMNEVWSVDAQVRAVFPLTDNDRGFRPGSRLEGRLWMAYRFNDFVSASDGVRAMTSNSIQGIDPDLETFRDPGDLGLSFDTQRVDLPLGLNLRLPSGPLAGHRFGVETAWTVHQETDGPLLADNWAVTVGWQSDLGLPRLPSMEGLWPF